MFHFRYLIIASHGVSILNQVPDDHLAEGLQQLIHSRHSSVDALRLGEDLTGERSFRGANLVTNAVSRRLTTYVLVLRGSVKMIQFSYSNEDTKDEEGERGMDGVR